MDLKVGDMYVSDDPRYIAGFIILDLKKEEDDTMGCYCIPRKPNLFEPGSKLYKDVPKNFTYIGQVTKLHRIIYDIPDTIP